MSIEILPARLANQIAAGEVVERPASVVKELVENSLDAGATTIIIDIDKGGAKKIRVTDNGQGIVKEELTLALSRHATSKIKNLDDLEAISSLGFRGEALASISSVSRLTLTSKPHDQHAAWQAQAEGREMAVQIQPAAHPDGTTIELLDLFFNTPARRKFLRTEKTEFAHIDEVVRRVALARFDVAFTLIHNGKVIRQFRALTDKAHYGKRVALICGKSFMDNALLVDCQHDNLHLWGWVANAGFYRSQNDLCYSYVNGRMMRDKLINHALRQAFADSLPNDGYPAFVLFLTLDHREVDVNVHPAKHEVRFHQARYVHDFICSVINNVLLDAPEELEYHQKNIKNNIENHSDTDIFGQMQQLGENRAYVTPIRAVSERNHAYQTASQQYHQPQAQQSHSPRLQEHAIDAYQRLMTTSEQRLTVAKQEEPSNAPTCAPAPQPSAILSLQAQKYALVCADGQLRLLSLPRLAIAVQTVAIAQRWQAGIISQPLLLPIVLNLTNEQTRWVLHQQENFTKAGIVLLEKPNKTIQIRQFPAFLRHQDVHSAFMYLLNELIDNAMNKTLDETPDETSNEILNQVFGKTMGAEATTILWCRALAALAAGTTFTKASGCLLIEQAKIVFNNEFDRVLLLNSVPVDLTSEISQLA